MKKSIAMKWAKDLEKNYLKQGYNSLRPKKGKYCCLGRLCVMMGMKYKNHYGYDHSMHSLPKSVMKKTGIKTSNGMIPGDIEYENKSIRSLSQANDVHGLSFKDIAKIIRKHYRKL